MSHTWLKNPETGGVWACPDDVVDVYVDKRGWEPTEAPPEPDTLRDPKPAVAAKKTTSPSRGGATTNPGD